MCQVKCHLKWDLSHLAKTSLKVCRKPFEMLKRNATKSHFINHKYKCWSCLLKDDNITAIWLFKELDIAQSRHIVLCKKECFFLHLHLSLHFFLQPHFISSRYASDVSERSLHKGKKLFSHFTQPQYTGSKFRHCFRTALDDFIAWWQDLNICFWR